MTVDAVVNLLAHCLMDVTDIRQVPLMLRHDINVCGIVPLVNERVAYPTTSSQYQVVLGEQGHVLLVLQGFKVHMLFNVLGHKPLELGPQLLLHCQLVLQLVILLQQPTNHESANSYLELMVLNLSSY